jgi:hypothetical protein
VGHEKNKQGVVMVKFTPENFADEINTFINNEMREKARQITTKGVSATYDGSLKITFDKPLAEDKQQDRAGVILKGGIILTQEGQRKKKQGETLADDDYYILNGINKEI